MKRFNNKLMAITLSLAMAASAFSGFATEVQAAETGKVTITQNDDSIVIGNDYISREYSIDENGKIQTSIVSNKRIDTKIEPQEGSEDFAINAIAISGIEESDDAIINEGNEQQEKAPENALDRSNWDVTITNSSGETFSETHTNYLIDGDLNTNPDEYTKPGHPFYVDIDLGEEKTVRSLSVDKRPGYKDVKYGINGTMGKFELYVSDDGENWEIAGAGEFTEAAYNLHQENNLYNVGERVYANFYKPYTARYIRVVQLSTSMGSADEFTTAELNLYEDQYYGPNWNVEPELKEETELCSSDLTFKAAEVSEIEGGKKLTISYEPYVLNATEVTIKQIVVLEDDDPYMRSFIEIDVPENQRENLTIDYIDTDRFVLPEDAEGLWTHPEVSKISSSLMIGKYEFVLGQPIYANGFYMGSEFPATDTVIADGKTQIRYYSGKSIAHMEEDNQLTVDGTFVSWQNVIGAATGIETATVQTDFFAYIEEIATPTEFRKQYNSWYDNMMNITDESIETSFLATEANLSANGIEPLASYVVDDGWNNYYSVIDDTTYVSAGSTAGSITPNRTGFWEFNNKFPNELYTSSALAEKLNSTFGLWVGPRGGYNYNSGFARYLEASGTAYYTSTTNDICVASKTYTDNLKALFVDYEKRFGIDYWKWDGFANKPCTNASHDHMTGGYNNMYYTSDLWERWTDVFEAARAAREEDGKGLFINATCYMNLSPWLLQWVNTVWIQTGADTGQLGTGERHEQKIYFRDQSYYKLYIQNEVQFPMNHLYNHDPIYGVSDNSSATTEVFREYLMANAMRGTAFWELYFSPSIMDDAKWKVTADVLAWAEENHEVLKNAKLFGSDPGAGVYGYSCWNGNEGIISFMNPLATETTYTLEMNEAVGVRETVSGLTGIQVEPYAVGTLENTLSYGDTLEVTLQPHETLIYHYGKVDSEIPEIVSAKATGTNEITVKFDERVQLGTFTVNGADAEAELKEDYRTVVLTTAEALAKENTVEVKDVTDFSGNVKEETLSVTWYKEDVIAYVSTSAELEDGENVEQSYDSLADVLWLKNMNRPYTINTKNVLKGTTDFTVSMNVKTTDADVALFNSNDEVNLFINEEGFVEFKVGALVAFSEEEVVTVVEKAHGTFGTEDYVATTTETTIRGKVNDGNPHSITAVREANGMIKLYIDGELASSVYDESHINEELVGGEMTVADAGFTGEVAEVQVLNRALKYNESAEKIDSSLDELLADREGWTATACSGMDGSANTGGDRGASAAIDGDVDTRWHTNYTGEETCEAGTHWIQINFNKEESFDKVHYTSRGPGFNGSIKDYKLELLDAEDQVIETFTGAFSSASGNDVIELGDLYQAYGIRLTAVSTHNGADFAAADEINISVTDTLVSEAELQAEIERLLAKTEDISYENYTEETVNALKTVVEKISNLESAGTENLKALEAELDAAIAALEEKEELPAENDEVVRISGTTRYETGYKVADALKAELGVEKFEAVVVATGKNFADALAGSYLAVEKNAPILLTNGKDDNIAALHEYIAANVAAGGKVYILGGEGAVPAAAAAIDGYDVVRLSGKSRYETNLAILAEAGIAGDEIIVATGKTFADSLSASAAKLPILLVKPGEALSTEAKAIAEGMKKFYIIGGEGAVSAEIAAELAAYGEVIRVSGKTRYETSVAVANTFFADVEEAVVANGKNFPDGLCGGPLAAAMNAPLILTADGKTDAAADYMAANAIASGFVLGGTGALADESVVDVFALESADEIVI